MLYKIGDLVKINEDAFCNHCGQFAIVLRLSDDIVGLRTYFAKHGSKKYMLLAESDIFLRSDSEFSLIKDILDNV